MKEWQRKWNLLLYLGLVSNETHIDMYIHIYTHNSAYNIDIYIYI